MSDAAPYREELDTALSAVRQASRLCMGVLHDLEVTPLRKDDASPVTIADFGSQAVICHALDLAFPQDPVVAEESSKALLADGTGVLVADVVEHVARVVPDADRTRVLDWIDHGTHGARVDRYWTLDPVDGTKGFLRGAQFAIALALIERGAPVLAAVACPKLEVYDRCGVLAWAVRGSGARLCGLNEHGDSGAQAMRVRPQADPGKARFAESWERTHSSHGDAAQVAQAIGLTTPPIRMDSQAKYVVVASGQADLYMRLPEGRRTVENVWDHAAGSLLVEEAGGRVTDMTGKPLDFGQGRRLRANRGVIASNDRLHDAVLDALRDVSSG